MRGAPLGGPHFARNCGGRGTLSARIEGLTVGCEEFAYRQKQDAFLSKGSESRAAPDTALEEPLCPLSALLVDDTTAVLGAALGGPHLLQRRKPCPSSC